MTDENKQVEAVENVEVDNKASNVEDKDVKTVSVEEMKRRLDKANEKHKNEMDDLKSSIEKQIAEAVSKAKMSEDELRALNEKEKQKELENAQNEVAMLKAEINKRKMQDVAIKELEDKSVPVNENTLAFVVKDDEESTKLAVANMATILNLQKQESAKSNPPLSSGSTQAKSSHDDRFSNAKITNF